MRYGLSLILTLVVAMAIFASAETRYQRFEHPLGIFSFEYPSGWQAIQWVGKTYFKDPEGKEVTVSVRIFPTDHNDPSTPEARFENLIPLIKSYGGHLDRNDTVVVSGISAQRIESRSTNYGDGKERLELIVIVPRGNRFYEISLFGLTDDTLQIRPEFDRILASFRLGKDLSHEIEWYDTYNGPKVVKMMVARTREELREMEGIFPIRGFWSIDFDSHMLVAISLGERPSGGYSIRIEDTIIRDDTLHVRYCFKEPKIAPAVITKPYSMKVMPTSNAAKVAFENTCGNDVLLQDAQKAPKDTI